MTCETSQSRYISCSRTRQSVVFSAKGALEVTKLTADLPVSSHSATFALGRLGTQILNLLDLAGARAAERRELMSLDRRELDDCGLTLADVRLGLPDLYANDFRVAHIAERRAA